MHEKNIKRLVKRQLKNEFPNWGRLSKKDKKRLAKKVLNEAVADYDFKKEINVPLNELTGISRVPAGIIKLDDMEKFIQNKQQKIFHIADKRWEKYLRDKELRIIHRLIENEVMDRILALDSYTPSKRIIHPHNFFRAEMLKALKYPELSYRKYCETIINKLENKTARCFIGLPLHKKIKIDHSELSQFRSGLQFAQKINLMIYMIHLLIKNGKIKHPLSICGVDSTEMAACCCHRPLATVKIKGKNIRIYSDLDADCGKRRSKRDKSDYVVGYRLHTLVSIDPQTGHNYPLFSLVAPANHHDNLFLCQLLSFTKAMGLNIDIVTADDGYSDAPGNEAIHQKFGVRVVTPVNKKAKLPEHVSPKGHEVFMNKWCDFPMSYMGKNNGQHEFKCSDKGECIHSSNCLKYRNIDVNTGVFGQIPDCVAEVCRVRVLRKNMERVYNLLKHREGLEPLRPRNFSGIMSAVTFAQMATMLLEIADTRRIKKKEGERQLSLGLAA